MIKPDPLELPPAVARSFMADLRAFYAEPKSIKKDEIAARQLRALRDYQGPRERNLRLSNVKECLSRCGTTRRSCIR
jgi:hypothetical protein